MNAKPLLTKIFALFAAAIVISSCSSVRRTVRPPMAPGGSIPDAPGSAYETHTPVLVKRAPYVLVQPDQATAEKYADILGVKKRNIQNGRLYTFLDQWIGTPYLFGGLDHSGVDCSGFVYLLQQQVYDVMDIPRNTGLQINYINQEHEGNLKEGDLVFFDFDGKHFSHVGIYLQNGYIVHASTRRGVVIVKLQNPSIYKYFSACGSVPDVYYQ